MTFGTRIGLGLAALALCLSTACGSRNPQSTVRVELHPRDLYPLQKGNAWSYDVDTGEPSTTLAVTRVAAFDGRIAEVQTGAAVVRYEVNAEGIRLPPDDVWLLRAPLREGASWPARGGRSARLVSNRLSVETAAGAFRDCVEVLESGGELGLEVRTVFCPGVGAVSVDSTLRSNRSERSVTVSARLRGYQLNPGQAPVR